MSRRLIIIASSLLLLIVVAGLLIALRARLWERAETGAGGAAVGPSAQSPELWERPGARVGKAIVGPDGGRMVWVPAGEFMMGSPAGEGEDNEHPAHRVRITKGFWLGRCTVTNLQYRRYCQEAGVEFPKDSDQGDDHPVVWINWTDAQAYCKYYGLSLPTEAQWEYAARGPKGSTYPWGDEWDPKKCCNWENRGPMGNTSPVGSFRKGASWCGALGMAGNVLQWCKDCYSDKYYASSPDTDPPGPNEDAMPKHAVAMRGSCWDFAVVPKHFRCACRKGFDPANRFNDVGFRCVRGL